MMSIAVGCLINRCSFITSSVLACPGGPVFVDQLERTGPDHVRGTGPGGHLQGPPGQERAHTLSFRPNAPHHQAPRRALRLQDPHLGECCLLGSRVRGSGFVNPVVLHFFPVSNLILFCKVSIIFQSLSLNGEK